MCVHLQRYHRLRPCSTKPLYILLIPIGAATKNLATPGRNHPAPSALVGPASAPSASSAPLPLAITKAASTKQLLLHCAAPHSRSSLAISIRTQRITSLYRRALEPQQLLTVLHLYYNLLASGRIIQLEFSRHTLGHELLVSLPTGSAARV